MMRGKFEGVCILAVGFAVELAIMGEADKFLKTNAGYTVSIQGKKDRQNPGMRSNFTEQKASNNKLMSPSLASS